MKAIDQDFAKEAQASKKYVFSTWLHGDFGRTRVLSHSVEDDLPKSLDDVEALLPFNVNWEWKNEVSISMQCDAKRLRNIAASDMLYELMKKLQYRNLPIDEVAMSDRAQHSAVCIRITFDPNKEINRYEVGTYITAALCHTCEWWLCESRCSRIGVIYLSNKETVNATYNERGLTLHRSQHDEPITIKLRNPRKSTLVIVQSNISRTTFDETESCIIYEFV